MPPFDYLSEGDLIALTVYMLSLKDVPSQLIFAPSEAKRPEEKP